LAALLLALLLTGPVRAEVYELPPDGYDVVGALSSVSARYEDTLVDIARRHGLGYQDIVHANPNVNVWVPGEGTEVLLPTRFILPPGPREGLVLNLAEYRMYYFLPAKPGEPAYVYTYPISIGRMDWETPLGETKIVAMAKDPAWYPPESVRKEHAADGDPLPRIVPPGPDNPLGSRALRLGLPGYLIHGTNRPAGVGMRVSHGCIRMFPEDIEFLFQHVRVNTPVRIINAPVKLGWDGDVLMAEIHPLLESRQLPLEGSPQQVEKLDADTTPLVDVGESKDPLTQVTEQFIAVTAERAGQLDWGSIEALVQSANGIPEPVGARIKNAATSAASE
jgi:L,D-transpeptidase ErfK/SrfK